MSGEPTTADELLRQLLDEGGAIVNSNDCNAIEIANAQTTRRMYIDKNQFGFVRRTRDWLALQKSRET